MEQWQKEMIWLTVVYRLAECNETIPMNTEGTRFEFIDKELTEMHNKGYIKVGEHQQRWVLDKKGREMLTRLVGMFDQFLRFEIFSDVIIDVPLDEKICDEDGNVLDQCFDPRFAEGDRADDLRIAMMEYFVESCKREGKELELDPHRIIFLQMLADGKFAEKAADFWFNLRLGEIFKTIEGIVKTNYHWQDLGNDDEESWEVAQNVYSAGMLEQRKREGQVCSSCGIPLAIFEAHAQADGEELLDCPDPECGASFRPEDGAPDAEYECPQCKADVYPEQTVCTKCGARIDFSLPEGAVVEETVEETTTETVDDYYDDGFGCYYGYCPTPWYDPWCPIASAAAFGVLCGAMIY